MKNNIYLKIKTLKKNTLKLYLFNHLNDFNIFFYILDLNNSLHYKVFKRFLYENGLKTLLITNHFKIGLKYNYIYNLLKI